jgi:hypothetical protein
VDLAFDELSSSPCDTYSKAALSIVENLCQREGIKIKSQKALSLITKMSSILLQIEVGR